MGKISIFARSRPGGECLSNRFVKRESCHHGMACQNVSSHRHSTFISCGPASDNGCVTSGAIPLFCIESRAGVNSGRTHGSTVLLANALVMESRGCHRRSGPVFVCM